MSSDRFYFRQLLAGRDFATDDPVAQQMVNFVYLVGDRETGEAVAIDPAYDIKGILAVLAEDGLSDAQLQALRRDPAALAAAERAVEARQRGRFTPLWD